MKQQPLYKRYRDWDAHELPEDRTSQEEKAVVAKLGPSKPAPSKLALGRVSLSPNDASAPATTKKSPETKLALQVSTLLDEHLENSILFLLFVYRFTLPKLDMTPPDANKHTPIQMRDQRLLQQAKASYQVLGPHIAGRSFKAPLMAHVHAQLQGCHERIVALHTELETEPHWHGTFVQRYVAQEPPLVDCITGKRVAVDSSYVLLHPSGRVVSRDDHVYLSALHVALHFWDYVMWAFQEHQDTSDAQEKSIYALWNRLWGATTGPTWKYMGATPFRQRIIQLRVMFLAAAAAATAAK